MDEPQPDASRGDSDGIDTGEDEVDAQQLLSAASRAIAAVRRQAAELYRHRLHVPVEDDEQAGGSHSAT